MRWFAGRSALGLVLLFAASCVFAAARETGIPFERRFGVSPLGTGARRRLTPRPLLYAEVVTQYGQFQNFLHYWLDRPLFFDRSLRPAPGDFRYETSESFRVSCQAAADCGLDGFAVFGNYRGRLSAYEDYVRWVRQSGCAGLSVLPMVFYGLSGDAYVSTARDIAALVRAAQANPDAPEVAGRKVLGSYNFRMAGPAAHARLLGEVRKQVGNDRYMILGDLDERVVDRLQRKFRREGRIDRKDRDELEALVRDELAATDGLHLRIYEYDRPADGPYPSHVDQNFLDGCLREVLLKAYALPENEGKALACYVMQGYVNNLSGMNHGEFGTATLRNCMTSALALNPDLIVFFEWNEENENTMFQPTVMNGQSVGRIIRCYSERLRGGPPTPCRGDDGAVPSLILSYRATFKPGEKMEVELLNVPAGEAKAEHDVRLSLYSGRGERLVELPAERLETGVMNAVTYAFPGECFSPGTSVVPVMEVDGTVYGGFHPMRVDATRCVNFKCVRQALRDLPRMRKRGFALHPKDDCEYEFSVDLACEEKLASVELVCNENEVAACDPEAEYDRSKYEVIRLAFVTAPGKGGVSGVGLKVRNAPGVSLRQDWKANVNPGVINDLGDCSFSLRAQWFAAETPYCLLVPRESADAAEIEIAADGDFGDGNPAVIPVRSVLERGSYEAVLSVRRGFRAEVRRMDALPDVPRRLGLQEVEWKGRVRVDSPAPAFHVRAITANGRIWRSKVIEPRLADDGGKESLAVYSEWKKRAIDVPVRSDLIPDIDYEFTPASGAALMAGKWQGHNASLGGGYVYGGAFNDPRAFGDASRGPNAPEWVKEGESWMLRFDGKDDYLHLPNETFPVGAFTLETEFRPQYGDGNMVIFRHAGFGRGSLQLFIVGGALYAMWADRDYYDPKRRTACFETGLALKNGDWNSVSVSYDFRNLSFAVNGRRRSFPFDRRGYIFHPGIFGGHALTSDIAPAGSLFWFRGDLRRLRIRQGNASLHTQTQKGKRQ